MYTCVALIKEEVTSVRGNGGSGEAGAGRGNGGNDADRLLTDKILQY